MTGESPKGESSGPATTEVPLEPAAALSRYNLEEEDCLLSQKKQISEGSQWSSWSEEESD